MIDNRCYQLSTNFCVPSRRWFCPDMLRCRFSSVRQPMSRLFCLALLTGIPLVTTFAQESTPEFYDGTKVTRSEVILQLRTPTDDALASLQVLLDADQVHQIGGPSGTYVFHSRHKTVAELVDLASHRADIVYVEPNYLYHAMATPNDPSFSSLWSLYNVATPGADIHVVPAWDVSTGSRQNIVAELDTGVDYTHPDLAANIWSAPAQFTVNLSFGSLTCPAGSHGYNALAHSCDPMDSDGHGTHVAGIVGAVGNNLTGITGVNWTASIMPIRIAPTSALGIVSVSDAIDAIEFAIQVKSFFAGSATPVNVRVLSNSWGGNPFSQALLDEINRANTNDMLFVAAAGNLNQNSDIYPLYPASYNAPNVIAVAATNSSDALASFSNYGAATVHLGAPGTTIFSTWPGATYRTVNGTSMAAPHVSGAAVLVLSACNLNTASLKSTLLNNVDVIPALTGKTVTGGRLNVNRAIRSCIAPQLPPLPNGAVSFLKVDVAAQGTWKGRYGTEGYAIAGDSSSYPAYAQVSLLDPAIWPWASTTTDVRGLQKAASATDRIASTWYDANTFLFDVNLTDGKTHQVGLYLLDWDFSSRAERVDILDAVSGMVLDTRNAANFGLGKYVLWNLAGHIQIRVTLTGGLNAVVGGIFFDAAGASPVAPPTTAAFVKVDATTQGSWKGQYGADGYSIVNDSTVSPGYALVSVLSAAPFTWANSTADVRALQKAASPSDRIASSWYNSNAFWYDIAFTDGNAHQVAIYLLDWDFYSRTQRIDILDSIGNVLDTRSAASFGQGQYFVWNLSGHVQIQVTRTGTGNAVASGIFFATPDFTIGISPGSQTVNAGTGASYTTTLAAVNGYSSTANFSVSGLPAGATGTFNPTAAIGSGSSTMSVTTSSSTAAGTYLLTITATGGSLVHSTTATLVVNAPPDFTIGASPGSQTVIAGTGTSYATTVTAINGYAGTANFSVSGLPAGATGTFNPTAATGSGSSTLSVTTGSSTAAGTYLLTITATGGSLVHSTTATLVVNASPDFTIGASPGCQTVIAGTAASYTTTLAAVNGYSSTANFSVSGLPAGTAGTFSPTAATSSGSSTLSVATSSSTAPGTYLLTITATSGSLVHSTTATLVVSLVSKPNSATFLQIDTTTEGTWKGRYGSDGHAIVNDSISYPAYAQVSTSNALSWTWMNSSTDVRALQKSASPTDRIATTWYNNTGPLLIDVNLTDANSHQIALYLLDWDFSSRTERIDILDAVSGVVLDTRDVASFVPGKYLMWNLTGHVQMRITTLTAASNVVVSGIFFDPAGIVPPVSLNTAAFVKLDTATQGLWNGQYGADGYAIANDSTSYPGYAQVSMFSASPFTWINSTADLRALQKVASSSDRIASTWYNSNFFVIDINFTDGKAHQVALYLLDWDFISRTERIDILDGGGSVLVS